ncbi:hypothetical protein FCV25MIE_16517 [Fagus crenata]
MAANESSRKENETMVTWTWVTKSIHPDHQWWNELLTNETIKWVQLLHLHNKDGVLWIDTASGLFTVRSAYSLAMQQCVVHLVRECSSMEELQGFWRKI